MPVQTGYSKDPQEDGDSVIREAVAERKGRPIRIRLQPQVLRAKREGSAETQYVTWKDVIWTIDCDTLEEVFELRTSLRAFFAAMGRGGPGPVVEALSGVGKEKVA